MNLRDKKLGNHMIKNKLRVFSAEEKSTIVLELLKEEHPLSVLASKYGVTPKSIKNWKRQFLANAPLAFEPAKAVSDYKEQITKLKGEIDELAKALGKTTVERDWAVGKLNSLDLLNKKRLVDSKLHKLSKTRRCELLNMNRSSIYYQSRPMHSYNLKILDKIDKIYTDNPEYGYRYIHRKLLEDDLVIGKDRVLKYMNLIGIEAIYPKKKKSTSIKNDQNQVYSYLLDTYWTHTDRTKTVYVPNANEVWSGDITYIRTKSGFMYLAAIIDWHSKAVLSYKISNTMDVALVRDVLKEALNKYPAPKIFNSDQGSQYTSNEHRALLQAYNIQISMNGKGRSIDNIIIERFFRTLKYNCISINNFDNIQELKDGVRDYIKHYNYNRFHSTIGYKKPMDLYLKSIQNFMPLAA